MFSPYDIMLILNQNNNKKNNTKTADSKLTLNHMGIFFISYLTELKFEIWRVTFLAPRSRRLTWWAYSIARLCRPSFVVVGKVLSVASLGWGKGCIRFWGRSDKNCGYHGNRKLPFTYNGENGLSAFSQSPIIGSLSNLHVTRTGIKSRMGSNLGRVGLFTTELFALSVPVDFEWGKWCLYLFSVTINSVFIKRTGNEDRHKIADGFEFRSYLISYFGVTCPWAVKKKKRRRCLQLFSVTVDWIFVKRAGNEDRHKSFN